MSKKTVFDVRMQMMRYEHKYDSFIDPELVFEVRASEDDCIHFICRTEMGKTRINSINEYNELKCTSDYCILEAYEMPKEAYEEQLRIYGLKGREA